jgi:hypothetical protein
MDIVACLLAPWFSGKNPDSLQWYQRMTSLLMYHQSGTVQCSNPSGNTQKVLGPGGVKVGVM